MLGFSLSLGNRTRLWLIDIEAHEMKCCKSNSDGTDRYENGTQLLPASWLDDSREINNQKRGEMIANVSLKFSLVKTKIVLSPDHCPAT